MNYENTGKKKKKKRNFVDVQKKGEGSFDHPWRTATIPSSEEKLDILWKP